MQRDGPESGHNTADYIPSHKTDPLFQIGAWQPTYFADFSRMALARASICTASASRFILRSKAA